MDAVSATRDDKAEAGLDEGDRTWGGALVASVGPAQKQPRVSNLQTSG